MPNVLGNYDEEMFAQLALIQLEKELGMGGRVHRGYDPTPKAKGSQIGIRRPSTFVAQEEPSSAQDVNTEEVNISLNFHWGTKIKLTDKDLSLSVDQVVTDHVRPMAVAIADKIDQTLCALYKDIPWVSPQTSTPVVSDLAAARKIMRDMNVPLGDESQLHYMMDSTTELEFIKALAASPSLVTDPSSLRRGSIGRLFGFDCFPNQNTPIHTSGVAADATGAVDFGSGTTAVYAVGTTTMHIDALTSGATLKTGDTFVLTNHTQRYVLTADGANESGGDIDITFAPPLKVAADENEVITFVLTGSAKAQTLAWHTHAFALAMAPLSTMGADVGGARMATVSDPKTNLSLRSRLFYVGNDSAVYMALDALWGVKTLNPNLAVRVYDV
jgi:hypothetical protein